MDPLSQGLLGAAAAQALVGRRLPRSAWAIGLGAGLLADADVFFTVPGDPVATMALHRHFTHALLFIPAGGLLAAALLAWLPAYRGARRWVVAAALAGYATHALLDACTSYGTLLYWPISDHRAAWDVVSVIDPLFTLPLLAAVVIAAARRSRGFAAAGLVWCAAYLGLGMWQHHRAMQVQHQLAEQRGQTIEHGRVMPTLGNMIIWRSVYAADGRLHADAVRLIPWDRPTVREGVTVPLAEPHALHTGDAGTDRSIDTFAWFADGYLAALPGHRGWVGDMRYSLDPSGFVPLWALRIEPIALGLPAEPDRAAALGTLWRQITVGFEPPPIAAAAAPDVRSSTEP